MKAIKDVDNISLLLKEASTPDEPDEPDEPTKLRSSFFVELKIGGFAIFLIIHLFFLFYLKIFKIT
jgi:hypothetical protein